jgi:hypothetical protein
MGCWNEKIFGGDTPLDWKDNMYQFCDAEEYGDIGEKSKPIPKDKLSDKMVELQNMIDSNEEEDDKNIGYLVLAALIMRSGLHFGEVIKERVMNAIDEDEWAKENPVRRIVMKNYKSLIKGYNPENPINIENVSLQDEPEESDEDELGEEFKQIFGLMNARVKRLKKGIEEKSGVDEYDEGYADASQESIDFLIDFKELISKQEQFGILLERIENGTSFTSGGMGSSNAPTPASSGSMSGGKDINVG